MRPWTASNDDRSACCAYCYRRRDVEHAVNTHVLKWQGGVRLTGPFEGITMPCGMRKFACGPCAERIRQLDAARGNTVKVYRYRPDPGRRRAPRRRAGAAA